MEILVKVLQLILSLSLLVFVHELGHYLTARFFGIRVDKFYIFMDVWGVSLFKFNWRGTEFGLGWLPFGGYCKIAGMVDESLDTKQLEGPPQPWEFRSKPAWQRLVVMIGGVVMNVITAIVIYTGMSLHWGDSYVDNRDITWGWSFSDLGREIGFRDGDRIVSFDGAPVTGSFARVFSDMVISQVRTVTVSRRDTLIDIPIPETMTARLLDAPDFMSPRMPAVVGEIAPGAVTEFRLGDSLTMVGGISAPFLSDLERAVSRDSSVIATVMRAGELVTVPVRLLAQGSPGVRFLGMGSFFSVRTRDYNFWQAIPAGFRRAGDQIAGYWQQLKLVVNPRTEAYKGIGSLLTIGSIFPGTWDWLRFWTVTAFLSIILAVMNILPIPALDGGHALFVLWEMFTGRRPSDKFLERVTTTGMVLLIGLMVLAFWNDIYRFFIR